VSWLASWPKSGNTWVRMMLTAYRWGTLDINMSGEIVVGDCQPYAYHTVAPTQLKDMTPAEILFLRHAALAHIIARFPHNPVVLKSHNANVRAGSVDLIPQEMSGPSVYVVRDPRDVLVSYADHMGHTLEQAAESMNNMGSCLDQGNLGIYHHLTTWSQHVRSWAEQESIPVKVLRYEDLLEDPRGEFQQVLEHLGLSVDEERLDLAVELASFDHLRRQEQENGFREASPKAGDFFKRGTAGGWQEVVPREIVEKLEADHREVMQMLGYEPVRAAASF